MKSGEHVKERIDTYKFQYIEIPFLLKMKTREYGYFSYYAKIGLGASFVLSGKEKHLDRASGVEIGWSDITHSSTNPFRASFIVGLGGERSLTGSTKAIFGITFNNGLTYVVKKNNAVNNLLCLEAGILF